ncbi:heme-binding domain-containing protein [Algoriphagus zhangzhouensis]|uniref:Haem-binding domain-containing protein n=1 Tax=Algoriphagus zhangzhouensis TaxID=1073327 RepID=A0A1M7Z643_9BACT|nr:heme-binding domain-containing protein [Algoriphagus zhangzhouensis]TDY48981.1 heme-binding protein [Algoriphagus zhangzhouensis]SHO60250.1 Haem-binding domain-containing protein [Algoriphagus zhangzhouensis]
MKKLSLLPIAALVGVLFFQAIQKPEVETHPEIDMEAPKIPAKVKAVIDQKCYGCHNAEAKGEKAKKKLDWDQFEAEKKAKQLAAMSKINEALVEGEMPPKKFLENKPEGKLTEEEMAILLDWSAGKKKSGE